MSILANEGTRILVQGITGREAATFVSESIQYGAQIIAGVTPGKGGLKVSGVPVFDTVAGALKEAPCNATIISVPASFVRDAAWEALDNGLRLLLIVTENIPKRDVVAVLEFFAAHQVDPDERLLRVLNYAEQSLPELAQTAAQGGRAGIRIDDA